MNLVGCAHSTTPAGTAARCSARKSTATSLAAHRLSVPRLDLRPRRAAGRHAAPHGDAGFQAGGLPAVRGCGGELGRVRVRPPRKDPAPLAAAIGERAERYHRYGFADLRIGKRIVLDVAANWKLLAENFSECFHCPPVHPEFCRIVTAYQEAGAWGLRGGAEAKPEYREGAQTLTLDGTARLPAFGGLNDEERARLYAADTVLPNLFLNVHPDYVNSQLMFPTGPAERAHGVRLAVRAAHLPLAEADLRHYVALWDITNRQDARNCEWQQQGLQSREFRHGVYVPQEFDAHRFAQWVRAGLALSAPAAPSARR
jgi:phenylpropionate dioxygenase-like ring-hydroxylating dioxygenase large terminal subunit